MSGIGGEAVVVTDATLLLLLTQSGIWRFGYGCLLAIENVDLLDSLFMTQADRIRRFALDHYITPARAEGRASFLPFNG